RHHGRGRLVHGGARGGARRGRRAGRGGGLRRRSRRAHGHHPRGHPRAAAALRHRGGRMTGSIAARIQHTLIEAGTTRDRVIRHARECIEYGFGAAMVAGSWVDVVAAELDGTGIPVASALDFPVVGSMTTLGKAREAEELVRLGAQQIDIGVQVGWLKSGNYDRFRDDIAAVVACGVPIKVMLELPLLTPEERDAAVDLSLEAGAAYLKNASSGAIETADPAGIR